MDYFIMQQDQRIFHKLQFLSPVKSENRIAEQMIHTPETIIIYVKENRCNEYPGYIEAPMKLIPQRIKRIIGKYQPDIIFKPVILIEKAKNRQEEYYAMNIPAIECASETSTRDALGNVKEFVLDEEKVRNSRIFLAKDYGNQLLIRLDVAESILRREAYGIWLKKVNIRKRGKEDE